MIRANSRQTVPSRLARMDNYLRHKEFQPDFDLCHSCHPCNSRHPDYPCPPRSGDWERRRPARFPFHFPPAEAPFMETKRTTKQPANKTLRQFRLFPTMLLRRQLKQLGTTLSRCAAQPGGACQKKGPSNCHLGGATFQSRPSEWVCGRVEIDKPDKGERPAGAVTSDKWAVRPAGGPLRARQTGEQGKREGCERKTHAETRRSGDAKGENRQTIPTNPDNFLRRQLKQLGTTLSRCAAQPGSAYILYSTPRYTARTWLDSNQRISVHLPPSPGPCRTKTRCRHQDP